MSLNPPLSGSIFEKTNVPSVSIPLGGSHRMSVYRRIFPETRAFDRRPDMLRRASGCSSTLRRTRSRRPRQLDPERPRAQPLPRRSPSERVFSAWLEIPLPRARPTSSMFALSLASRGNFPGCYGGHGSGTSVSGVKEFAIPSRMSGATSLFLAMMTVWFPSNGANRPSSSHDCVSIRTNGRVSER